MMISYHSDDRLVSIPLASGETVTLSPVAAATVEEAYLLFQKFRFEVDKTQSLGTIWNEDTQNRDRLIRCLELLGVPDVSLLTLPQIQELLFGKAYAWECNLVRPKLSDTAVPIAWPLKSAHFLSRRLLQLALWATQRITKRAA